MFCPGTGLPVVLPPAKAELLGSWLMRIAQFYGLSLATLLSRVGAKRPRSPALPPWFALRPSLLDVAQLAAALRVEPRQISIMAPPRCRPHWPSELGLCRACLEDAAAAQQPLAWSLRWLHPLAVACTTHRCWLTPITTQALARIRHPGDLLGPVDPAKAPDRRVLADALWVQRAFFSRTGSATPWGKADAVIVKRVLCLLDRVFASASAQELATLGMPDDRHQWQLRDFRVESERGERSRLTVPQRLLHRQWLMSAAGHLLRRPPDRRFILRTLPGRIVQDLAATWVHPWPDGTLQWISPEAAALRREPGPRRPTFGNALQP